MSEALRTTGGAEVVWRTTALTPEMLRCDLCGQPADSIHLHPWVNRCERALFACPAHDPGGNWFTLDRWFAEAEALGEHIAMKYGGVQALALLDERFDEARRIREESERP